MYYLQMHFRFHIAQMLNRPKDNQSRDTRCCPLSLLVNTDLIAFMKLGVRLRFGVTATCNAREKTSATPVPSNAEHSMYFLAPHFRASDLALECDTQWTMLEDEPLLESEFEFRDCADAKLVSCSQLSSVLSFL